MDAILLCMKKRGIRFFSKIKFPNTTITRFNKKETFLSFLRSRIGCYDNVLVMAHGASQGILTTTRDPSQQYILYITLNDVSAFKNDFVFAVSCSTANEFGKKCVEEGAIAYLGYQVEIGGLFSSYTEENRIPKRINELVDNLIKRIFIEELSQVYEKFLNEPISVQVLKELFSFSLEKRISSLLTKNPNQIEEEFGVKIQERDYNKYIAKVVLDVLSYLDEVTERLVCIGDCNYISATSFLKKKMGGINSKVLLDELENNTFYVNMNNPIYKKYLRELLSKI